MKKYYFLLLVCWMGIHASGQVVIGLQLPPTGLHLKSQLWSLSLINTGLQEPNVKIEMLMTDASNNQQVLSATSSIIQLKKGASLVTAVNLSPVVYNVLNMNYGIDANPVGFLPVGVFNICFRVIKVDTDLEEQLAEDCETVEIEPVSPPMLMLPMDLEYVESTRPLFSWIPPAPQVLFSNLSYDLVLVEVISPQDGASAIQQNVPVYSKQNISFTTEAYPGGYPELDTSKTYAWQVTAKNNDASIATSEVWTFRVKKFAADSMHVLKGEYYSKLRKENDASYIICTGLLKFEYLSEQDEPYIQLKLTDISTATRSQIQLEQSQSAVKLGQNFIVLNLSNASLTNQHIYQLEVWNARNERSYLKFEYRQPSD